MGNKIQELTDKIFHEGVEKGNEEADRLVAQAQKRAEELVAEAEKRAAVIESEARKRAEELEANTKSELRLRAGQAVDALKSEIADLICGSIVSKAVGGFTSDKDFFNKFVVALASKWSASEAVVIESSQAGELREYFKKEARELLDGKVDIREVNGRKAAFTIAPANGAYKVSFGSEEFESYFRDFLRPQLVEMLFNK